jgi:hypothetical protein
MKKLLAVSLLGLCLLSSAKAGDVPFPGKGGDPPPPAPCTENCTAAAPSDEELDLELLIEVMLTSLVWR